MYWWKIAYDKEVQRISKAVHYKLNLGQNSLLGAQMYNTARPATAILLPDKDITQSIHALNNKTEQRRGLCTKDIIPQLDGAHNVSDSSDTYSHEYLRLGKYKR